MLGHDAIDVWPTRDRPGGPLHPCCFCVHLFREGAQYVEVLLLSVFAKTEAKSEKAEQKERRDADRPSSLAIPTFAFAVRLGHRR